MDLVAYDDDDRRYLSLPAVLLSMVLVALVGVGATLVATGGSDVRASEPSVSAPQGLQVPSPSSAGSAAPADACAQALRRADTALERSARIEQALAAQTQVVDGLLDERLTAAQVLDRSLPALTQAATDRTAFLEELAAYRAARGGCPG